MQTFLDSHPRKLPQRMREAEESNAPAEAV
jgi:hypothetical protein